MCRCFPKLLLLFPVDDVTESKYARAARKFESGTDFDEATRVEDIGTQGGDERGVWPTTEGRNLLGIVSMFRICSMILYTYH